MWRRPLALALAGLAIVAIASSDDLGKAPRRRVYEQTFAEGPGKDIAERTCLYCHSQTLVTQQAKDSTAWEKTLGTMQKWGAKLTPAEHDSLRDYLLGHYGPRPHPSPKPR